MAARRSPMAVLRSVIPQSRPELRPPPSVELLSFLSSQVRRASSVKASPKKKKQKQYFRLYNLNDAQQFSLCDAMRYIHAFEVGKPPSQPKYELAIKLRTPKSGAVIRNQFRLPHPVKTVRICVICPPKSKAAQEAKAGGAVLVGEDEVIDAVKAGKLDFDRCICHPDSLDKILKSGIARILGPRGMMPSPKMGTVGKDIGNLLQTMVGGSEYRERAGVLRLAVAQVGFTPEQVRENIQAAVKQVKKDAAELSDRINKDIHEVVLSSTHSPGFTLNGEFRSRYSLPTDQLVFA